MNCQAIDTLGTWTSGKSLEPLFSNETVYLFLRNVTWTEKQNVKFSRNGG